MKLLKETHLKRYDINSCFSHWEASCTHVQQQKKTRLRPYDQKKSQTTKLRHFPKSCIFFVEFINQIYLQQHNILSNNI